MGLNNIVEDEYDAAAEAAFRRRSQVRQEQGLDGSQRNQRDLQRQLPPGKGGTSIEAAPKQC